ncbi:MAG: hypothetical protein LQ340_003757, partial [Diploschistes diacapsis]
PPRSLTPTITPHPKNPLCLKAGPLLTPWLGSGAKGGGGGKGGRGGGGWIRRHAELRPPYLHLYTVPEGEEVGVLNLRNARVDSEPMKATGLGGGEGRPGWGLESERVRGNCFCVYATGSSVLFAVARASAKAEWILAVDGVFGGGEAEAEAEAEDREEEGVWEV